ncbi:hypothetical protein NP233_g12668 [Leucocoprinus birnbaumii]|uniref:Uncharacterized protein n=1 Tax=Leucocoprinus birnbaumii TaxID=56174 RepID=A0AAD5VEB2_9AGAR|nr:hypothetical protein NP233_g12668 [Leucocoprinus birnbaumii]
MLRGRERGIGRQGKKRLTVTMHDAKELHDDSGEWASEDLALARALGIDNVVQTVILPILSTLDPLFSRMAKALTKAETRAILSTFEGGCRGLEK